MENNKRYRFIRALMRVNLLLGNGADVHMRLVDGTTAIQVALKNGHAELAYSLQARESQH